MKLNKAPIAEDDSAGKKDGAEVQKKMSWMRNILLGIIILVSGILTKFFPDTVTKVVYLVCGVIFLLIGVSDGISALKYKETGSDWQSITISGTLSLIASVWFILAFAKNYSVSLAIIIAASWFITRGIMSFVGLFRGKIKRKEVIIPSALKVLAGILAVIFREIIITYTKAYIGYVLLALGALLTFVGLFMRADAREKKERDLREADIARGYDNAIEASTPEAIEAPADEANAPQAVAVSEPTSEAAPAPKPEPTPAPEPIPEAAPKAEASAPEQAFPEPSFGQGTASLQAELEEIEETPAAKLAEEPVSAEPAAEPAATAPQAQKFDEEALDAEKAEKKKKSKFGSWFS